MGKNCIFTKLLKFRLWAINLRSFWRCSGIVQPDRQTGQTFFCKKKYFMAPSRFNGRNIQTFSDQLSRWKNINPMITDKEKKWSKMMNFLSSKNLCQYWTKQEETNYCRIMNMTEDDSSKILFPSSKSQWKIWFLLVFFNNEQWVNVYTILKKWRPLWKNIETKANRFFPAIL